MRNIIDKIDANSNKPSFPNRFIISDNVRFLSGILLIIFFTFSDNVLSKKSSFFKKTTNSLFLTCNFCDIKINYFQTDSIELLLKVKKLS